MPRSAASLLCAVAAIAVSAAPAPVYRPDRTPWFGITDWDRPIDPAGDCRFVPKGRGLTISLPGTGHGFDDDPSKSKAPMIVRGFQGDFVAEVRVAGDFDRVREGGERDAGLTLVFGDTSVGLVCHAGEPTRGSPVSPVRLAVRSADFTLLISIEWPGSWDTGKPRYELSHRPARLRLERRNGTLRASLSDDGEEWSAVPSVDGREIKLPDSLKVGVIASSTGPGKFEADFDQFKLTPLK